MNLYSKKYGNSNPENPSNKAIRNYINWMYDLLKTTLVSFQVKNHSVGHLMPKASQPWEKNGMIWGPTFCNKKDYCFFWDCGGLGESE